MDLLDFESDDELIEEKEDGTLMHHIVLPRVLPKKMPDSSTEKDLMDKMVNNVKSLAEYIPAKTVGMLLMLQAVHDNLTMENISKRINDLAPGETFAMFIRSQGCAIAIYVPPDERDNDVKNVIVATFPGSLDPSEIYAHDSDIEVCCFSTFNELINLV